MQLSRQTLEQIQLLFALERGEMQPTVFTKRMDLVLETGIDPVALVQAGLDLLKDGLSNVHDAKERVKEIETTDRCEIRQNGRVNEDVHQTRT